MSWTQVLLIDGILILFSTLCGFSGRWYGRSIPRQLGVSLPPSFSLDSAWLAILVGVAMGIGMAIVDLVLHSAFRARPPGHLATLAETGVVLGLSAAGCAAAYAAMGRLLGQNRPNA